MLQQCLPFTVLKLSVSCSHHDFNPRCNSTYRLRYWNTLLFTTRFAHDFRSSKNIYYLRYWNSMNVWLSYSGTRLQQHMVCAEGGEATESNSTMRSTYLKYLNEVKEKRSSLSNRAYRIQYWNRVIRNCTPAFLGCNSTYRLRYWNPKSNFGYLDFLELQQPLPFTVLKLVERRRTRYFTICCNSTYRLRYAPQSVGQQRSKATMRSSHPKCLSKAKVKQRW